MNKLTLSKEIWYVIIEQDLIRCKEKFDTLEILSIHDHGYRDIKMLRVNYKTTKGNWSTGFGVYDVQKKDVPQLLRETKINQIISE